EKDHLPVAELVARRLDEQGAIRGQATGRRALAADVVRQVAGRGAVQETLRPQPVETVGLFEPLAQFADEPADGEAEVETAPAPVALPEGAAGGGALGGGDQDAVGLDAL